MKSLRLSFIVSLLLFLFSISNTVAQTVFTTKTGEKYHVETCRYLKYSKRAIDIEKAKGWGKGCRVF